MCGRYELDIEEDALIRRFNLKASGVEVKRRYNVAPSQTLPIITEADPDQLTLAQWGLRPFWARPGQVVKAPINARGETVDQLPTFRTAFHERRCLVPATAFYEWQKLDGSTKQPYRIALTDDAPFAFAGLYGETAGMDGAPKPSYTIVTTDPNELMAPIHNRMPVILTDEDAETWLNPDSDPDQLKTLLAPYPTDAMHAEPISTLVNSPANDTPAIRAPQTP
jgi:putative SOS response-associated peptidase YedK